MSFAVIAILAKRLKYRFDMLTTDQQFVISLLRQSFSINDSSSADIAADPAKAADIILRSGILLTVFPTVEARAEVSDTAARLREILQLPYYKALKRSVVQNAEGDTALRVLSDAGFDCIGLKGWEMRRLYPADTMRQMADLDILVRPYDFGRIKKALEAAGFQGGSESNWKHDNFRRNGNTVELHKRLTDDSDAVQQWENELWSRAAAVSGHIYRMSPEDYYIFHFIHMLIDFKKGSLGLRRIADTWLLQKQPVDPDAVGAEFEKMGMAAFHEKMKKLARVTMGEEEMDRDCELMLNHAFLHGIYGTGRSYKAGRIVSLSNGEGLGKGKLNSWLAAVFLPYSRMKAQYPKLMDHPALLPYYWVKRITHYLRGDLAEHKRRLDYSDINESDYEEMKSFLQAGGVLKQE